MTWVTCLTGATSRSRARSALLGVPVRVGVGVRRCAGRGLRRAWEAAAGTTEETDA
jgi:hypothetical protein